MRAFSFIPSPSTAERISPRAFTLVDLLAVLAVLALCATMLAPALARTKSDSRVFQCLNNHAQLARAWLLYAADNKERLAINKSGLSLTYPTWAAGWLDWSTSTDNTNTLYFTNARYAILAPYGGNVARLFKCPADTYVSPAQRHSGWSARVRSVSQNLYAATGSATGGPTGAAGYVQVTNLTGLLNPSPSETWVSIDEHPDSINDGGLYAPRIGQWIDLPANYHDGGAGVAFADGHSELHRWQASVLNVPIKTADYGGTVTSANDPDIAWLRYRTPRKAGAN